MKEAPIEDLVRFVARALVTNKDAVEVSQQVSERATVFEFKVDPSEVGKVIGREGKTIHAIRTVVQASARAQGKRVLVEVAHGRRNKAEGGTSGGSPNSRPDDGNRL